MVDEAAQRVEQARDLKQQIAELRGREDEAEIIFRETSPQRRRATIYSMTTGEPVEIPLYMLERTLRKRLEDGGYMFTADPGKAPEFKLGQVKCFLHKDSPERPILDEIGLAGITCPAAHLSSAHSKRMHAQHRHRQEWTAYTEYLAEKERAEDVARQQQQLDAMLALAGQRGTAPSASGLAPCGVDGCDFVPSPDKDYALSMDAHRRHRHPEGVGVA